MLNVLYERRNRFDAFALDRCGITDSILSNAFDPTRFESRLVLRRFVWVSVTIVADLRRFFVGICMGNVPHALPAKRDVGG